MLVPLAAFTGWALQRAILNRVVGDDPLPSLIATFGLSIALQNLMQQIWFADTRSMPGDGIEQASFQIGSLYIGVLPVIVRVVATLLTSGLACCCASPGSAAPCAPHRWMSRRRR